MLCQLIVTVTGATYEFLFWSTATMPSPSNQRRCRIGGDAPVDAPTTVGYALAQTSVVASSASTKISFDVATDLGAGFSSLDDVSVVGAGSALGLAA